MGHVWRVWCLGSVRATVNGITIALSPDQRVLLATLAAAGPKGMTKGQLYEELFAANPQKSKEQAVVMRLQRLRQKLNDACVAASSTAATSGGAVDAITRGPRYSLEPSSVAVDVWEFEEAFKGSPSSERTGPILVEWEEPFQGLSEDPLAVVAARSHLKMVHRVALERFVWSIERGVGEEMMPAVFRSLALDPFDESLAAAAAAALYRLGRQPDALEVIARLREVLVEEHGLDSGPLVDQIEAAILNHDAMTLAARRTIERPEASDSAPIHRMQTEPRRFVGRSEELRWLGALLGSATTPGGQRVPGRIGLILGPAGSGKTTLVSKTLTDLAADSFDLRLGQVRSYVDGPAELQVDAAYAPILRALPELHSLLPDLSRSLDPDHARVRFWQRVHQQLVLLSARVPLVVVLEDMHEADSQSLGLIRYLAGVALPPQVLMLITARLSAEGDLNPELENVAASTAAHSVDLAPLTVDDLRSLVALDHPGEPPVVREQFAERIGNLSQGNALVASIFSRDALPGLDPTMLPDAVTPAESLAEHLAAKVNDPELEELLAVAALIGMDFDAELLGSVLDRKETEVEVMLERAHAVGVCLPHPAGSWTFDHLLTLNYFATRLRLLRPMLFARLARLEHGPGSRVVRYVVGAGRALEPEFAVPSLLRAADELENRLAFTEALTAVVHGLSITAESDPRRYDLLLRGATYATRSGAIDAARNYRAAAFAIAQAAGDTDKMCAAALAGLPSGEFAGGEPDRLRMLESIDPDQLSNISAPAFARWQLRQARLMDRTDIADRVVAGIRADWREEDALDWTVLRLEQLMFESSGSDARPVRAELEALAADLGPSALRAQFFHRIAIAALTEQHDDGATSAFERAAAEAYTHGTPRTRWSMDVLATALNRVEMRPSTATIETARLSGLRWGIPDVYDNWGVQLWVDHWLQGDFGATLALIEATRDGIADNVAWHAGEAVGAAAAGDLKRVGVLGRRVQDELAQVPSGRWSKVAAALLVEAAAMAGNPELAASGAEALKSDSGRAIVLGLGAAYFGPVDRYLAYATATCGDDPEPMLLRARAQAERSGAVYWQRRIDQDLDQRTGIRR